MARIRTIKPEFPQSESVGNLSRDARLLFIQIWTICDDAGRARAAPRMLASLLYPYDDDAPDLIDGWLVELERAGSIRRYKVGDNLYLEVVNWLKHQKIEKPSASKLPPFNDNSPTIPLLLPDTSPLDLGPRTIGKDLGPAGPRTNGTPVGLDAEFESWYASYPVKKGRGAAIRAFRVARSKATLQTLIEGANRYAADPARKPEYTKHPATWLNGECWRDETSQASKPPRPFV